MVGAMVLVALVQQTSKQLWVMLVPCPWPIDATALEVAGALWSVNLNRYRTFDATLTHLVSMW